MSAGHAFTLQIESRLRGIPAPARFRRWLKAAFATPARATLRIVNRAEAHRLNREYRGRDYATNVLTFAYGGDPPEADIVLCAPVVLAEARAQGKEALAHFAHLTVHGALHAQGLDHEKSREAAAMEAREIAILGTLGFADPYTPPPAKGGTRTRSRQRPGAARS